MAGQSLDFVHDQFANGQRFRVLNVVDHVTRECLAAIPDTSISGRRVARELTALIQRRGPWHSFEAVRNIPPAEAEANFYAALETEDMAV